MSDFILAHLSDPHLNPLPGFAWREIANKRIGGYVNWRRSRRHSHDMAVLERVVADMARHNPQHVACTGDVAHIGLAGEFDAARAFLATLGPVDAVSFVPGNHDAYLHSSVEAYETRLAPWSRGDGAARGYPWLKRRGHVALVGICSGIPTGMFMAWGRAGPAQIARAGDMLTQAGSEGLRRVVLIHHPPHVGGAKKLRNLVDAADLEAMLKQVGADLVIHGHNHRNELAFIAGPERQIPVLGVASASVAPGRPNRAATWQRITLPVEGPLTVERRTLGEGGQFHSEMVNLDPNAA